MLNHTGALMQLIFEFAPQQPPTPSDPFELSNLGGVNWRVDAVFDPASNSVLTSAVQVEQSAAFGAAGKPISGVNERRIGTAGATLVTVERPMLPDFELLSASLDPSWIPVSVATFWDGPAGLGLPGPQRTVDDLPAGQPLDLTLTIPLPAGFHPDDTHTLHVVINPSAALAESDASNNAEQVTVGALPTPVGLENIDGDASGTVVIHWQPVNDPRVTGYRVYRRNPDGSVLHVGATGVAGFADFAAYPEQRYEYFVTSHSSRLAESAPSQPVAAWTLDPDRIFGDGFESSISVR